MRMLNQKNTKTWHHAFKRSNLQIVILYSNFIFNRNFVLLLFQIVEKGISYLSINFFTNFASRNPKEAGILCGFVRDNIIYEYCYTCFFYIWSWNSTLFRAICEGISI